MNGLTLAMACVLAALAVFIAVDPPMSLVPGPFPSEWPASSVLSLANYFTMAVMPYQVRLLEHVMKASKVGDVDSVIDEIDAFCWAWPSMNVGPVKGAIADQAFDKLIVDKQRPLVVVELGSYMGYSTLRFGRHLAKITPAGSTAHLYSIDPNPLGHAVKLSMLDRAGLLVGGSTAGNVAIHNELDYSGNVLKRLADEGVTVDYLFLDHVKDLYKEDTQLALSLGLLKPGSLVVADNVVAPGVPEYRAWMLEDEDARKTFKTTVHETLCEYTKHVKDEVLVSVVV